MEVEMSLKAKRELLFRMQSRYAIADRREKGEIIDGVIAATGYHRKYAIWLLKGNGRTNNAAAQQRKRVYDDAVRTALATVWNASGQLCSKRLAPFLPEFVSALEKFGHLSLPADVRAKLISLSAATIDRLLKTERAKHPRGICTTRPGNLLKQRIKVRTFAEWNETGPGFFEGDLVAHCGDTAEGSFLNSLVLTDIYSGWMEFAPLLRKCDAEVISGLDNIRAVLPIPMLGLDTDNGSEFINHALVDYCGRETITFTRSRAYKKNDQAQIEQKNGSVVRRVVGYDRFEGIDACNLLLKLYRVLRLHVNFFQPSTKLLKKKRVGSRTSKQYDVARTPYRRLLDSDRVTAAEKHKLKELYKTLDPVMLFEQLAQIQEQLWQHAIGVESVAPPQVQAAITLIPETASERLRSLKPQRTFKRAYKRKVPVTWRTRKDPFEGKYSYAKLVFSLEPQITAKELFARLQMQYPDKFRGDEVRTLQRRVAKWRREELEQHAREFIASSRSAMVSPIKVPDAMMQVLV
jgi:hypothetical protein